MRVDVRWWVLLALAVWSEAVRSERVYDVVVLSGLVNSSFAPTPELADCVQRCTDHVDYHSLFLNGTFPFPLNPIYYDRSFPQFCDIERRRKSCIENKCSAVDRRLQVWISGLQLCQNTTVKETFLNITNRIDTLNVTKQGKKVLKLGQKSKISTIGFTHQAFLLPLPPLEYLTRLTWSSVTEPCMFAPFDKWKLPFDSCLPSNYGRDEHNLLSGHKSEFELSTSTADFASKTATLLSTVCQHLYVVSQLYRRYISDNHINLPRDKLLFQYNNELLTFFIETSISPFAYNLRKSAEHYHFQQLLEDTICSTLENASYNDVLLFSPENDYYYDLGLKYVQKFQKLTTPNIKWRPWTWGHSSPMFDIVIDWRNFDNLEHKVLLFVYIQNLALKRRVFNSYEPVMQDSTYPRNVISVDITYNSSYKLTNQAADVTCMTTLSCATSVSFPGETPFAHSYSVNVSLRLGITDPGQYQFDYLWTNDQAYSVELSATKEHQIADPEVILLFVNGSGPYSGANVYSKLCYVKAFSREEGMLVYSTVETCESKESAVDEEEPPFKAGKKMKPHLNVEANGKLNWWKGNSGLKDRHAYDWVAGIVFSHNISHIIVEIMKNGNGKSQSIYQLGESESYFSDDDLPIIEDIAVDPLRSSLICRIHQPSEASNMDVKLLKINYRVEDEYVKVTNTEAIFACACNGINWNNNGEVALYWNDVRTQSKIMFICEKRLYLVEWNGRTCDIVFKDESLLFGFNLQVDNKYIYYYDFYNDVFCRVNLQSRQKIEIGQINYTTLPWEFRSWNFAGLSSTNVFRSNLSLPGFQNVLQNRSIQGKALYAIVPYTPHNYPLPATDCFLGELHVLAARNPFKDSYDLQMHLTWRSCDTTSRPPIGYAVTLQTDDESVPENETEFSFESGPTYSNVWQKHDIVLHYGITYNIFATANLFQYYDDASCNSQKCLNLSDSTTIKKPRKPVTYTRDPTWQIVLGVILLVLLCASATVIVYQYWVKRKAYSIYNHLTRIPSKSLNFGLELGSGRFGCVVESLFTDEEDGGKKIKVAIKMIKSISSADDRRRFQDEAILLATLKHRNVIRAVGICLDDWRGGEKFVMELIEGGSLLRFLTDCSNRNAIRHEEIATILTDVGSGLAYLHGRSVIHNDIASRNCLVEMCVRRRQQVIGRVVIADFGLAKHIDAEGIYQSIDGTRQFPVRISAPEVLSQGRYSKHSDCWMFACLIWQVLRYGETPWSQYLDNEEVVELVLRQQRWPELPVGTPQTLSTIMRSCFQFRPTDRVEASQNFIDIMRYKVEVVVANPVNFLTHVKANNSSNLDNDGVPANIEWESGSTLSEMPLRMALTENSSRNQKVTTDVYT